MLANIRTWAFGSVMLQAVFLAITLGCVAGVRIFDKVGIPHPFVSAVVIAMMISALLGAFLTALADRRSAKWTHASAAIMAGLIALGVGLLYDQPVAMVVLCVFSLLPSASASYMAAHFSGDKDPALFWAALPLGIGPVIGTLILASRRHSTQAA